MSFRRYTNRALIFWLILAVVAGVAWVVKAMFGRIARTKKAPSPKARGASLALSPGGGPAGRITEGRHTPPARP